VDGEPAASAAIRSSRVVSSRFCASTVAIRILRGRQLVLDLHMPICRACSVAKAICGRTATAFSNAPVFRRSAPSTARVRQNVASGWQPRARSPGWTSPRSSQDRDAIGAWIEGQGDRRKGKRILGAMWPKSPV
jgi:hypothetical protein